jgi:hypothetical protein
VLEPVDAGVELVEVADDGAHELGERQSARARTPSAAEQTLALALAHAVMPAAPRSLIDVKELEGRVATVLRWRDEMVERRRSRRGCSSRGRGAAERRGGLLRALKRSTKSSP